MSGCHTPLTTGVCYCECHVVAWMGVNPPHCVCACISSPTHNFTTSIPFAPPLPLAPHPESVFEYQKEIDHLSKAVVYQTELFKGLRDQLNVLEKKYDNLRKEQVEISNDLGAIMRDVKLIKRRYSGWSEGM